MPSIGAHLICVNSRDVPMRPKTKKQKFCVYRCDCVGILKERNVDVEHRFPDQSGSRNKKKSTRCRMVFRTAITHPDDTIELLQTTSQPIVCSK
jgi:nuclear factor of activated T-cells 5